MANPFLTEPLKTVGFLQLSRNPEWRPKLFCLFYFFPNVIYAFVLHSLHSVSMICCQVDERYQIQNIGEQAAVTA